MYVFLARHMWIWGCYLERKTHLKVDGRASFFFFRHPSLTKLAMSRCFNIHVISIYRRVYYDNKTFLNFFPFCSWHEFHYSVMKSRARLHTHVFYITRRDEKKIYERRKRLFFSAEISISSDVSAGLMSYGCRQKALVKLNTITSFALKWPLVNEHI